MLIVTETSTKRGHTTHTNLSGTPKQDSKFKRNLSSKHYEYAKAKLYKLVGSELLSIGRYKTPCRHHGAK